MLLSASLVGCDRLKTPTETECKEALAHSFTLTFKENTGQTNVALAAWSLEKHMTTEAYTEALTRCTSQARVSHVKCMMAAQNVDAIRACGE